MNLQFRALRGAVFRRTALALALAAISAGASAALPAFTLDPAAVGLAGAAFSADNLLISDYSTVTDGPGGTFTEAGYLSVTSAQMGGSSVLVPGLDSTYGLYIQFSGTGTTVFGSNPLTGPTFGVLNAMTFTLYGYNGTASFGFSGTTPTTSATGAIALATGTLVPGMGTVSSSPSAPSFSPTASATLTMDTSAAPAFFAAPSPFLNTALTSFSNTNSQVQLFTGGFMIQQGGGSVNFATAVPEPGTYAMLASGLGVIGFLVRRRSYRNDR